MATAAMARPADTDALARITPEQAPVQTFEKHFFMVDMLLIESYRLTVLPAHRLRQRPCQKLCQSSDCRI
ncbi:hypothetical protein BKD03_01200 [Brucella sp. 09RB8471]|nr:hypothetical protein BKD03_01200 [Brucella sp. 09RB8471]APY16155.1 hypothetical protein BKD02_13455 [Brucella sp. 09RB8910]